MNYDQRYKKFLIFNLVSKLFIIVILLAMK